MFFYLSKLTVFPGNRQQSNARAGQKKKHMFFLVMRATGYRLAAEVNRQHSECVLYTHTLRVLPIHFGRETVPSDARGLNVMRALI